MSRISAPSPPWHSHRVMIFNGQRDTHIGSPGRSYQTLSLAEVFALEPTDRAKEHAPAFIPSSYCASDARSHNAQRERGSFVTIAGDVDKGNHPLDRINDLVRAFAGDSAWRVHSTNHSRPGDYRWRITMPLNVPLPFQEWEDAQAGFFDYMESNGVTMDRSLQLAGQPVYLPNVPPTHDKTGTPLRDPVTGAPLYYQVKASDADLPGLRLDQGLAGEYVAAARTKRLDEEIKRAVAHAEAQERRAQRAASGHESVIDWFNDHHSFDDLLPLYGYEHGGGDDYRSPNQQGGSYATRIMGGESWVSLSGSDDAAGVGAKAKNGVRYGDLFDLFVHYGHKRDFDAAISAARSECALAAFPDAPTLPKSAVPPPAEVIEPVDLFGRFAPPPLPRGLLPPVIEQFAVVQGEYMGADPAGLAMAALTVCAASLPDSVKLRVKPGEGWAESARLWSALIGTPSAKKSPIINEAARPLKRIDAEMARANAVAMAAYRSLSKEDREATPPPAQPRLRLEDATVEAVGEVLKDSPDGLLILQDELSGWFGAMDKYSGGGKGAAKDRGFWLTAFNGGDHCITRVSRGNVYIPNLSVCLLGGIQPEAIRAVAATSVDDGLLQRMCPILLQPASVGCEVARDEGARVAYDALVQRLRGMRSAMPYTFDAGAQALRRELEIDHLKWMRGFERINGRLASHIGKYDGIFSRLCILFHCCEQDGHLITVDTAKRVAKFLHGFLMRHAIGFYADVLGLSSSQDEIADTAGFILAHDLQEIDARVGKSRVRSLRKLEVADIIRVLEQLEGFGWLIPIQGPRASSRKWQVNGVVHERFAARAAEEAERRRADGDMLREMFADL